MEWAEALEVYSREISHLKPQTISSYLSYVTGLRQAVRKPLNRLKPSDVQAYVDQAKAARSKFSRATALDSFLRTVSDRRFEIKRPKLENGTLNCFRPKFTHDQIIELLLGLDYPKKAAACLAYGCGLRAGEVRKLKRSDLTPQTVTLPHAVLPVPRKFRHVIAEHLSMHDEELAFVSGSAVDASGHLSPLRTTDISKDARLSMRELRDAFAFRLADKGVDIFLLKKILGHEHVTPTARYYTVSKS